MRKIYEYRLILDEDDQPILEKEREFISENADIPLTCAQDIDVLMREFYGIQRMADEYAYMIAVNGGNLVTGIFQISHGSSDKSLLIPRALFVRLLLCGAVHFFLVHNHPSGNLIPSEGDIKTTNRIKECADLMGIDLLDHVIIAKENYSSFQELGLLDVMQEKNVKEKDDKDDDSEKTSLVMIRRNSEKIPKKLEKILKANFDDYNWNQDDSGYIE